jgi:peptide deformylase
MRSRYSAYVLGLSDYIVATTHPASPQYTDNKLAWKRSISQFSQGSSFHKLEILDFKENGSLAMVAFTAHLTQGDQDATFTEKSFFEKIGTHWYYRNGQFAKGHSTNLITTEELNLLPLAYYGDPILRKKADTLSEITDDMKKLVEQMIETMDASSGAGLAAPQIHHSLRLFVMRIQGETEERSEPGEVHVLINPKLSEPSKETWSAPEGCLSIPTIRTSVERPKEITVEYTALDGSTIKKRFSGWNARVIMHENDHINGVLFIDRLNEEERAKLTPTLQQLEKRLHPLVRKK